MIKNTDVRYGNYVMDGVSGEWMVIDEIGENVGATVINRDKYPLKPGWFMAGIPLTPELLIRSGFTQSGMYWFYESSTGKTFYVWEWGFTTYHTERLGGDHEKNGIEITSLHQLQNMVYFKTGEELPVKM